MNVFILSLAGLAVAVLFYGLDWLMDAINPVDTDAGSKEVDE